MCCVCVKVLKEELKIVIFSVNNLNVNEIDAILKHRNISNVFTFSAFKKYMLYSLIHMYVLGAIMHLCAKHEVSVIKPVDRRTVHRRRQ